MAMSVTQFLKTLLLSTQKFMFSKIPSLVSKMDSTRPREMGVGSLAFGVFFLCMLICYAPVQVRILVYLGTISAVFYLHRCLSQAQYTVSQSQDESQELSDRTKPDMPLEIHQQNLNSHVKIKPKSQHQPKGSGSPLLSSKVSQNAFETLADASAPVESQTPGASDLACARDSIKPCADPSAALAQPEISPLHKKHKGQARNRAGVKITDKAKVEIETAVSSDAYCSLNNDIPGDAALKNGDADASDGPEPENTSPDNATAIGPELTVAQTSDKVSADEQPVDPQVSETLEDAGELNTIQPDKGESSREGIDNTDSVHDDSAGILGECENDIKELVNDAKEKGGQEGENPQDGGGADEDGGTTVDTMFESIKADASASIASAEIPATGETAITNDDANPTGSTACDGKAGQEAISKNELAETPDSTPSGTQSLETTKSDGDGNDNNSSELRRELGHQALGDAGNFAAAKNAVKRDLPSNFLWANFHTQHLPKRHKSQKSCKQHKKESRNHDKSFAEGETIVETKGGRVALCKNGEILKEGSKVRLNEEIAMDFIAKHCPSITVPKVLRSEYGKYGRIYMTKVPGVVLSDVWSQFNEETKLRVCRDIWALIEEMRKVKRPEDHFPEQKYVTMDGGYTFDPLLGVHDDPPPPLFNDHIFRERIEQRYLNAHQPKSIIRGEYMIDKSPKSTSQQKVTTEKLHLPHCEKEVLTHGDLAPCNILVDPDTALITAILDWENAGWYPDYWEWAKILNPWNDTDWKRHMKATSPFKDQNWDVSGIMFARRLLH